MDKEVRDLEEGGLLRQLIDGVTAIAQDALIAVDVGDRRFARRGIHEARVHRH